MAKGRARPFNGYTPGVEAFAHARAHERSCDWPGCDRPGEFRAPKSRDHLDAYNWFCLEHVRLYNAAWNYYEGMSEEQIEAEIRRDTIGRRPTWPFGVRPSGFRFSRAGGGDPFGLFEDEAKAGPRPPPHRPEANSDEEAALVVLELQPPVTVDAVKARYKQLVKRHHPDVNGGDKASEEMFKRINQAYHTIMQSLAP